MKTPTIVVTVSGPQGVGKSSLARQLVLFLRGRGVKCTTREDSTGVDASILEKKGLVVEVRTSQEVP